MKKTAFLVIAVMIIQFLLVPSGYAEETDKQCRDVIALGIIKSDENGNYHLDKTMTRCEFAMITAALLRLDNVKMGTAGSFKDVSPEMDCYHAVYLLKNLGYINGVSADIFAPDEIITLNQAVKIILNILGYQQICNQNGGYPEGYMSTAANLRLFRGITQTEPFTKRVAAHLIYNALDIDMLIENADSSGEIYYISGGRTLRDLFENSESDRLVKATGIVTANATTWLRQPMKGMREDQVEIDGIVYNAGNTAAQEYLGMEVDYYVSVDDDNAVNTLTYVKPTDKNTVSIVDSSDFLYTRNLSVYYQGEGDRTLHCDLDDSALLVKNGSRLTGYRDTDITVERGQIRMIDNNGDDSSDVIFVEDFVSVIVKNSNESNIFFDNDYRVNGQNSLLIDEQNRDVRCILLDQDGAAVKPEDIAPGSLISVSASESGDRIRVTVCRDVIEGTVSEISEDEIKIGEEAYRIENGSKLSVKVSDDVRAYLNPKGEIAVIKHINHADHYGYIVGVSTPNGIDAVSIRVLLPGDLKEDYIIDDSDENNIIKTPILRAGNRALETYKVSSRLRIDGSVYSDNSEILAVLGRNTDRPVKLGFDQSGNVSSVSFPEQIGVGEKRIFNAYEKVFGGVLTGGFIIDDTTQVICAPANTGLSDDDYLAKIDMTSNGKEESIKGYDIDEESSVARLVVVSVNLQAGVAGNITDKLAVAEKVTKVADENGDIRTKVKYWSEGKSTTCYVSLYADAARQARMEKLTEGSIFYFSKDSDYNLADVNIVHQISSDRDYYSLGSSRMFGYVSDISYRKLSSYQSRVVNRLEVGVSDTGLTQTVELNVRNAPYIYLYARKKHTVSMASAEDIIAASDADFADDIFVDVQNQNIKAVVIVRD